MGPYSRHAKGGDRKVGWHKTKQERRRERSSRTPAGTTAPPGPADEAEQLKARRAKSERPARTLHCVASGCSVHVSCTCTGAAKVKAWRDRTGGVAARPKNDAKKASKSQRMRANASAEIAKLPKDLGATAEGGTQAFRQAFLA